MINALKLVSIQRGHDPRDFALVVGGGGGAMHAASLGRELGVKEIIVPLYPGLFSAWGMLATAPRCDFMQTVLKRADDVTQNEIKERFETLKQDARDYFNAESKVEDSQIIFESRIDLRYLGQEHTVTVLIGSQTINVDAILEQFHEAHKKTYTFQLDDTPVEFVTYRLTASVDVPRPELKKIVGDDRSIGNAKTGSRLVNFTEDGEKEAALYERNKLPPGGTITGPAIIEEATSTTLVHPGQTLDIDEFGFLHITSGT